MATSQRNRWKREKREEWNKTPGFLESKVKTERGRWREQRKAQRKDEGKVELEGKKLIRAIEQPEMWMIGAAVWVMFCSDGEQKL